MARDSDDPGSGTGGASIQTSGIVAVDGLQKVYPAQEGQVAAVDGVSFSIERGDVVGLLGPNGAGKTTIIKTILGLIEPTAGTIRVNGVDPHEDPTGAYRNVSAVLEGARNLYWRLTVRENLRFFSGLQGTHPNAVVEDHDRLLSLVGLEHKADEQVRTLSRGMQQKASLVCALARDTPILFLDEPTLGLDVEAARDLQVEIRRLAEEERRTIVLSSHDMDVIQEICDRVIIFNDGEVIADDTVESLLELFWTQTYHVTLESPVPEETDIETYDPNWSDGRTAFRVTLRHGDDFYRLTDAMEAAGASVRRIDTIEPDLEEIFLSVVEEASVSDSWDSPDAEKSNATSTAPVPNGGDGR